MQRLVEPDRGDQPLRVRPHREPVDALVPDVPGRQELAARRARERPRAAGGAEHEGHGAAGQEPVS